LANNSLFFVVIRSFIVNPTLDPTYLWLSLTFECSDPLILLLLHFYLINGLILRAGHTRLKYINFQQTFFRLRDVFSRIAPTTLRNLFSRISLVNGLLTFLLNSLSRLRRRAISSLIARPRCNLNTCFPGSVKLEFLTALSLFLNCPSYKVYIFLT